MEKNKIHNENCLIGLKKLPDNSIDCCITSPPYFGLRDYGTNDQIGLEESPEAFVSNLLQVFEEVRRVLKPNGTLWINLGDSYAGSMNGLQKSSNDKWKDNSLNITARHDVADYEQKKRSKRRGVKRWGGGNIKATGTLKPKDLIGVPWMVAFALRDAGWYLRQDIIWAKPNPMPESVTDRCTKSHEYIFLLSKSRKYYYDFKAIMQPVALSSVDRLNQNIEQQTGSGRVPGKSNGNMKASWRGSTFDKGKTGEMKETRGGRKSGNKERKPGVERGCPEGTGSNVCGSVPWEGVKANKRSVWTVTTKPFSEAHFATFPQDLIVDMVKAGCPEGGVVLDPFMGAGTTALVARKLNRNYIGFELNTGYIKIAEKRLQGELGMFI